MSKMKRQVSDILDLWVSGRTMTSIAATMGVPLDVVQYVIDQYGEDVV
jgi:hypothetical protein